MGYRMQGMWGVGCGVWGVGCGVWGVGKLPAERESPVNVSTLPGSFSVCSLTTPEEEEDEDEGVDLCAYAERVLAEQVDGATCASGEVAGQGPQGTVGDAKALQSRRTKRAAANLHVGFAETQEEPFGWRRSSTVTVAGRGASEWGASGRGASERGLLSEVPTSGVELHGRRAIGSQGLAGGAGTGSKVAPLEGSLLLDDGLDVGSDGSGRGSPSGSMVSMDSQMVGLVSSASLNAGASGAQGTQERVKKAGSVASSSMSKGCVRLR